MDITLDDGAYPEILWTFLSPAPTPNSNLMERFAPGIDRGRVSFYAGIDCHSFFPQLARLWQQTKPSALPPPLPTRSARVHPEIDPSTFNKLLDAASMQDVTARVIEGDEQDRPPVIDICVGREAELQEIESSSQRVCFITGIGGQGKSTLAAQYFLLAQNSQRFDYYVWRDCKEESERFENQLISLTEKLSHGRVSANELANKPVSVLTELIIRHANGKSILFVFDNIDHYVDLEHNRMTGSVDNFIHSFLRLESRCRALFTCRPIIQYSDGVLSQRLEGLSPLAAKSLFERRNAPVEDSEIQDAHQITNGHAFWLDLLAAQVAKKVPTLTLRSLLDQIRSGTGQLPTSTLTSIWASLEDRERFVLRALAETVRPETETQLGDYVRERINFNRFVRALRSLRQLNLVVVKSRHGSEDVIELHPLIREFIRTSFPKTDRLSFIDAIVSFYSKVITLYRGEIKQRPTLSILKNWTENAELNIEAGRYQNAFDGLVEVRHLFSVGDFPGEFARVAKLLFSHVNWGDHDSYRHFDDVFDTYFEILVKLGRTTEYEIAINKYESTVPSKTARYVNFCYLQTYRYWASTDYNLAIEWGMKGKELKDGSNVDTRHSTDHHLALARREAGQIDPALTFLLAGRKLEEVIDPDELEESRGGHHYGNIGRCLHLMGQIEPALVCYKKSAILIERQQEINHVENKAFVRQWIGELLIMKDEFCHAKTFLEASKAKWELVSPPRVAEVERALLSIQPKTGSCPMISGANIERFCIAWIFGRDSDFVLI
jgi:tetratricopeptide (TPR) repeat protein